MSKPIKRDCPRCYTARTLLDTTFALPGSKPTHPNAKDEDCINAKCVLPVKILMCPSCHFLELYHDVGDKLQVL